MAIDRTLLNRITKDIAVQKLPWSAGLTSMLHLTTAERRRRLGYAPGPAEMSLPDRESNAPLLHASVQPQAALPSSIDWRSKDNRSWLPPVKDQGNCGSCVAFGTVAALEAAVRIKKNLAMGERGAAALPTLSEAQLFHCSSTAVSVHSCITGWWVQPALDYCKSSGVAPASDFPYKAGDQACNLATGWQNRLTKLSESQTLGNILNMKEWIANHGPAISCFSVYDDFYGYTGGVYAKGATAHFEGGHCICVVGYDDSRKAWICRNSWGTGWGLSGYFLIRYGECGIDATMWAPVKLATIYEIPTHTDQTLLRKGDGTIWVIYGGAKFHVPNMATLGTLFPGAPIIQVEDRVVDDIPNAPTDGTLLREANGSIWVVYGGAKFHIPDPGTLNALFGAQPIYQLWDGALAAIADVPIREILLRETNGAISLVYRGARFQVPDPATLARLAGGLPMFQLWDDALTTIPHAPIDDTLLREDDGTIWIVQGGSKFHVPSMDVFETHYCGVPMRQIWNGALANIPTAPIDGTLLREDNGKIWVVYGQAKFHVPNMDVYARLFSRGPLRQLWDGALATIGTIPIDGTVLREESSAAAFVVTAGRKTPSPGSAGSASHVLWDGALAQIP